MKGNAGLICLESENDEPESAKNWEKKAVDAGNDEVEERRRWRTSTNFGPVDCIGKIIVDLLDNAINKILLWLGQIYGC